MVTVSAAIVALVHVMETGPAATTLALPDASILIVFAAVSIVMRVPSSHSIISVVSSAPDGSFCDLLKI